MNNEGFTRDIVTLARKILQVDKYAITVTTSRVHFIPILGKQIGKHLLARLVLYRNRTMPSIVKPQGANDTDNLAENRAS